VKNFVFSTSSRSALGFTQHLIQWVWGALSSGVKRPGREAQHSLPTNAEVKKNRSIHPLPHTPSCLNANKLSTGTTLHFTLLLLDILSVFVREIALTKDYTILLQTVKVLKIIIIIIIILLLLLVSVKLKR
jgi:hypothetical protein